MKWNVILQDTTTGKFQPYNIFEYRDFRLSMENLFKKQYPEERFLKELDLEIHYFFWAKIEWEIFIATRSNYIDKEELNRIISKYHVNRPPKQELPKCIDVDVIKCQRIDVYKQLRMNWERFSEYMWMESRK